MNESKEGANDDGTSFAVAILGTTILAVIGLGLAHVSGVPIAPQIKFNSDDVLIGIIATLPLGAFLYWFSRTEVPVIADFRESQIDFFSKVGFRFTPLRIVAMALAAGIGEEILFRGFFSKLGANIRAGRNGHNHLKYCVRVTAYAHDAICNDSGTCRRISWYCFCPHRQFTNADGHAFHI